MILQSKITCPHCRTAKREAMPTDACRIVNQCTGCGKTLRPNSGIAASFALTALYRVHQSRRSG
jgi:hypothetical protein